MADVRHALQHLPEARADITASIAVLPFANLSRDADDEYFSDGLSEEIINALTRVAGRTVNARTSPPGSAEQGETSRQRQPALLSPDHPAARGPAVA